MPAAAHKAKRAAYRSPFRIQRPRIARRASLLVIVIDSQRRMIAELDVAEDRRAFRGARDARRRDLVIDPPPDVLRVRLAAVAPPRLPLRLHRFRSADLRSAFASIGYDVSMNSILPKTPIRVGSKSTLELLSSLTGAFTQSTWAIALNRSS
jgi:hypothetical protein